MTRNRRSYWLVVQGIRDRHGLSFRQARAAWRVLRATLDRRPRGVDLARHPTHVRQAAEASALELVERISAVEVGPARALPAPDWTERLPEARRDAAAERARLADYFDEGDGYEEYEVTVVTEGGEYEAD